MKSAIYLGKENIEIRSVPLPEIGENDVLIRNIYSCICGTDVAVYQQGAETGHRITIGGEFGHERFHASQQSGKTLQILPLANGYTLIQDMQRVTPDVLEQ